MCCANLRNTNLIRSDLSFSDLSHSELNEADLRLSNLNGSDLSFSDLSGADLRGASLMGCKIRGAKFDLDEIPFLENIHKRVFDFINKNGRSSGMNVCHICISGHFLPGIVVNLSGQSGSKIEKKYSKQTFASLIYIKSDENLKILPDFCISNELSMKYIEKMANKT